MHIMYTYDMKITGNRSLWYHGNRDHALLPCVQNWAWFSVILNDFHCLFDMHENFSRVMIAYAYTAHSLLP